MTQSNTGGLRVPAVLGIDEENEKSIHNEWSTYRGVKQIREGSGLDLAPRPPFECPRITPDELNTEDNAEYTILYAQHYSWYGFVIGQLADVESSLLEIQNEMEHVAAEIRKILNKKNEGKKRNDDRLTAQAIKDEVTTDPRWHDLKVEEQRLLQHKTLLDADCESLERAMRMISRQVEIRKIGIETGRMEDNIPTRNRGMRRPE
jgi:hypothetical protein